MTLFTMLNRSVSMLACLAGVLSRLLVISGLVVSGRSVMMLCGFVMSIRGVHMVL
jgi:hypothetical protein